MGTRFPLIAGLTLAIAMTGCSRAGGEAQEKKDRIAATEAMQQAKARNTQVPAELEASGITIDGGAVALKPALAGAGSELEVTGALKNGSAKPVEGVNLQLSFLDSNGTEVGGHNTQQFFQPALPAGKEQQIILRVPALGGTVNGASAVRFEVLNRVKPGGSTDGWRPLDPNNMPEPKVVPGTTTRITVDGRVIKEGESDSRMAGAGAVAAAGTGDLANR